MRYVKFSYDLIETSQKINRDGAAQVIMTMLTESTATINNAIPLGISSNGIPGFIEPINEGEISTTEYYIKMPAGARVLLTRKFYTDEK